jgi:hypothetical protein
MKPVLFVILLCAFRILRLIAEDATVRRIRSYRLDGGLAEPLTPPFMNYASFYELRKS